jgi:glycosyltransferase 2 family protein
MTTTTLAVPTGTITGDPTGGPDHLPPGEPYYRHPSDVVRLLLWGAAAILLAILIGVATSTSAGVTDDLARAGSRLPDAVRELLLALTQVVAVAVAVVLVVGLAAHRRYRRLGILLLAGAAGAVVWLGLDAALDLPGRLDDAVSSGTWVASTRFPSLADLAAASAVAAVGKPWLGRPWRRATDLGIVALGLVMVVAGSAGAPEVLLAIAAGAGIGAALLVGLGAPNRRPTPAAVSEALRQGGLDVTGLELQRAEGGRSQLYRATVGDSGSTFVKVYGRDSRDADLLFRAYRTALLRGPNDGWPSLSLKHDVEREAFLLLLARQGGVACPAVETISALPDGSMVLALEHVDGPPVDQLPPGDLTDDLLDALWGEVRTLHDRGLAHRALRTANVLAPATGPVVIDLGFAEESASPRVQAIDRAELLASSAELVGAPRAIASATRVIGPDAVASAVPFLQPLGLSASTRRRVPSTSLRELREGIIEATGREPVPVERLVRVRPKTLLMIAALAGAFYFLLPQLANVDDSVQAMRTASWGWLFVALAMSMLTYVASAIGMMGGVRQRVPFGPTVGAQLGSSFVNRVTPANVGGMALNVRYLQKAGVEPADAVTGVALNSIAGAIVHVVLLFVFFAWAGQKGSGFSLPSGSKLLVVIAVVLALAGIVTATRRGRKLVRTKVLTFLKRSFTSMVAVSKSPSRLAALFGGSVMLTLAYIAALAACVVAFRGGLSIAQVGAVYLGASLIAAAAPTPGGLGALEAAVVAGLTGVGMDPGAAVAAVLTYRLLTYWLPIVPGWLSFHTLERRGLI